MDYKTTEKLFSLMDDITTFSRMYNTEVSLDSANWETVREYDGLIKQAREGIFNIMKDLAK